VIHFIHVHCFLFPVNCLRLITVLLYSYLLTSDLENLSSMVNIAAKFYLDPSDSSSIHLLFLRLLFSRFLLLPSVYAFATQQYIGNIMFSGRESIQPCVCLSATTKKQTDGRMDLRPENMMLSTYGCWWRHKHLWVKEIWKTSSGSQSFWWGTASLWWERFVEQVSVELWVEEWRSVWWTGTCEMVWKWRRLSHKCLLKWIGKSIPSRVFFELWVRVMFFLSLTLFGFTIIVVTSHRCCRGCNVSFNTSCNSSLRCV